MRAFVSAVACLTLALVGCAQEGGALQVTPETLELFTEDDAESLTLENVGNGELTVESITITPADVFTVSGLDLPLHMNSGDAIDVGIQKDGPEPCGERDSSIVIGWTSVEQDFESEVALEDATWDVELAAEPASLLFDTTVVDERGRVEFTVSNIGTCVVDITDIDMTGSESFFLVERGTIDPPSTRHTLPPGEQLDWDVLFAPEAEGCHRGGILIRSDLAAQSISVDISGPTPAFSCDE